MIKCTMLQDHLTKNTKKTLMQVLHDLINWKPNLCLFNYVKQTTTKPNEIKTTTTKYKNRVNERRLVCINVSLIIVDLTVM